MESTPAMAMDSASLGFVLLPLPPPLPLNLPSSQSTLLISMTIFVKSRCCYPKPIIVMLYISTGIYKELGFGKVVYFGYMKNN
jgi:hypothetical protein